MTVNLTMKSVGSLTHFVGFSDNGKFLLIRDKGTLPTLRLWNV